MDTTCPLECGIIGQSVMQLVVCVRGELGYSDNDETCDDAVNSSKRPAAQMQKDRAVLRPAKGPE